MWDVCKLLRNDSKLHQDIMWWPIRYLKRGRKNNDQRCLINIARSPIFFSFYRKHYGSVKVLDINNILELELE